MSRFCRTATNLGNANLNSITNATFTSGTFSVFVQGGDVGLAMAGVPVLAVAATAHR
jgi:hypothetical protein